MPSTYLCRGFRWHRGAIRIYVAMNNLEVAAPDWIIEWKTSEAILKSFQRNFDFLPVAKAAALFAPDRSNPPAPHDTISTSQFPKPGIRKPVGDDYVLRHEWSSVKLLEEYLDEETQDHCRPYAFVADYVVRVELDVDVHEEITKSGDPPEWFGTLEEKLQPDEPIRWYVVVIADEKRDFPGHDPPGESDEETSNRGALSRSNSDGSVTPSGDQPKATERMRKLTLRGMTSVQNIFKKKSEDAQDTSETSSKETARSGAP